MAYGSGRTVHNRQQRLFGRSCLAQTGDWDYLKTIVGKHLTNIWQEYRETKDFRSQVLVWTWTTNGKHDSFIIHSEGGDLLYIFLDKNGGYKKDIEVYSDLVRDFHPHLVHVCASLHSRRWAVDFEIGWQILTNSPRLFAQGMLTRYTSLPFRCGPMWQRRLTASLSLPWLTLATFGSAGWLGEDLVWGWWDEIRANQMLVSLWVDMFWFKYNIIFKFPLYMYNIYVTIYIGYNRI
jgi:hypothetical protein